MATTDNTVVQPGVVSAPAGTTPAQATTPAATAPAVPAQPSPEEVKLTELVNAKVAEALSKVTEASKREIQSTKDKAKAEVESALRKARLAETVQEATMRQVRASDPDAYTSIELARYKAQEEAAKTLELEEVSRRQFEEFQSQFTGSLREIVTDMGIDPTDSRIDWATDAPNYLEANKRVMKSAAKIKKDKETEWQKEQDEKFKAAEKKLRIDLGLDSVDTSASLGNYVGIPTNMEAFRAWVREKPEEYRKNKAKVTEMQAKGLIK